MICYINNLRVLINDHIFYRKNKKLLEKTLKVKNLKKGKKVFLFATGPSINILDPKKVNDIKKDNYDIFSLGGFLSSNISFKYEIDYYLLSDERTIWPNKFDLEDDLKIPINKTISELNKKKIKLFLPTSAFNDHNFKNEIFYFNNTKSKLSRNNNDITKSNDFNASGLKALLACVHLGYDEILICGLDNNFWNNIKVNSKNEILHLKSHFYENKNYIKHKSFKLISEMLSKAAAISKSFERFKNYNVINLDPDSLINCFNKKHNLDIYK